jgi:hypothetical protein
MKAKERKRSDAVQDRLARPFPWTDDREAIWGELFGDTAEEVKALVLKILRRKQKGKP